MAAKKGKSAAEAVETVKAINKTEAITPVEDIKTEDAATPVKKTDDKNVIRFPKRSFLRFERYARVRDLLGAMLDDDKKYSIEEVDEMLLKEGGKK